MDNAAERPSWWLCVRSEDRRFTAGTSYEVLEYNRDGLAVIATDQERSLATLPVKGADFVPHDPWATYNARLTIPERN